MCVSQVSVCAKLLLTLMTLPSLAQQAVTPPVFKRHSYQIPIRTCTHEHTQKHTHTPRPKPSESEIMDIPFDPILTSHVPQEMQKSNDIAEHNKFADKKLCTATVHVRNDK